MTDIFLTEDLRQLFTGKKVVFMGDSNVRRYYKDFLCLYQTSSLISECTLKRKMEKSVFGDKLVKHSQKTNARIFQEERSFKQNNCDFSFYFLTRVYNEYVEKVLTEISQNRQPDVIIINSCLWDMARWGPHGVEEYKDNIVKLMQKLKDIMDPKCLVIWVTTPPISQTPRGGFLVVHLDFIKYTIRFHAMEANTYVSKVAQQYGYDVLDIHYHLRMQLQYRHSDGIHWNPCGVRYIINLMLSHISLAWGVPLPNRFFPRMVQRILDGDDQQQVDANSLPQLQPVPLVQKPPTVPASKVNKRSRNAQLLMKKRQRQRMPPPPRRQIPVQNNNYLYGYGNHMYGHVGVDHTFHQVGYTVDHNHMFYRNDNLPSGLDHWEVYRSPYSSANSSQLYNSCLYIDFNTA